MSDDLVEARVAAAICAIGELARQRPQVAAGELSADWSCTASSASMEESGADAAAPA